MIAVPVHIRTLFPLGVALLAMTVSGCAQRGDFGRERPNAFTDTLLAVDTISTHGLEQGLWSFAMTDDERTMRDLGWTLIVPTHAEDWLGHTIAVLQNTNLSEEFEIEEDPTRYSMVLSSSRYRSSDVRYARIQDDAAKDMAAIGPFMTIAREVQVADQQRLIAANALPDITPDEVTAVYHRVESNRRQIERVQHAMRFRLYAYRYALDRLMIQTPSREANATIERLNLLEEAIDTALRPEPAQLPEETSGEPALLL